MNHRLKKFTRNISPNTLLHPKLFKKFFHSQIFLCQIMNLVEISNPLTKVEARRNNNNNNKDAKNGSNGSNGSTLSTVHIQTNTNIVSSSLINTMQPPQNQGSIARYFQPVKSLKRKANNNNSITFENSIHTKLPLSSSSSSSSFPLSSINDNTNIDTQLLPSNQSSSSSSSLPLSLNSDNSITSSSSFPISPAFSSSKVTTIPTSSSSNNPSKNPSKRNKPIPEGQQQLQPQPTTSFTLTSASDVALKHIITPIGIKFSTPSLNWVQKHGTLLVATSTSPAPYVHHDYLSGKKKIAIAAFDLDSTIVKTISLTPFPKDGSDWRWFNSNVQDYLNILISHQYDNKVLDLKTQKCISPTFRHFLENTNKENVPYFIVIITNQGGVVIKDNAKRYGHFKERLDQIASACKIPFWCYAATRATTPKKSAGAKKLAASASASTSAQQQHQPVEKEKDFFRKPETGMWYQLIKDINEMGPEIDFDKSFFVGDAAGRKNDFSDSDRKFARTLNLQFFTPEEFFIDQPLKIKPVKKTGN